MGGIAPIIALAAVFGLAGLFVESLRWALVISGALLLFAAAAARRSYGTARDRNGDRPG